MTRFHRRSRFYQAKLDSKNLASGTDDWGLLPDLYVIMITSYDPFNEDYMLYTVRNKFEELPEKPYEDGLTFFYFNTEGKKGGNTQIKSLLTYIRSSIISNVTDETTEKLHQYVEQVKHSSEVRGKYMTIGEYFDAARNEGRAEGRIEGREEGRAETLMNLLGDLGEVPAWILDKITSLDKDALIQWTKLAARADSMEAFLKEIEKIKP